MERSIMNELIKLKAEFADISSFLVALGDEKRQAIILRLLEEESCQGLRVNELIEATNLSRPAVSHHLKILRDAKLVDYRREGTKNYYYLTHVTTEIDKLKKLLTNVTTAMEKRKV